MSIILSYTPITSITLYTHFYVRRRLIPKPSLLPIHKKVYLFFSLTSSLPEASLHHTNVHTIHIYASPIEYFRNITQPTFHCTNAVWSNFELLGMISLGDLFSICKDLWSHVPDSSGSLCLVLAGTCCSMNWNYNFNFIQFHKAFVGTPLLLGYGIEKVEEGERRVFQYY